MSVAKQQKRGLGRGLSSLLGETYEPTPSVGQNQERTVISESDVESAKVVERPAARSSESDNPTPAEARKAELGTVTATRPVARQESVEKTEDAVIKEVVPREPDEVALDSIRPNPDQPRTNFKKEELEELASSIEKDGLLQPIVVRPVGDEYEIIAGERRWQACKMLGLKTVPVRIKTADDEKALELALIENIQRSDLNPIEEAYGYKRLMERKNMTQSELAQVVSKGRSTIANALRLLELPEEAQQLLFEEKITAGHARAILSIPSKEGRQKLTEKLMTEKLSVREAEALARLIAGREAQGNSTPQRTPMPQSFKSAARGLRETLGTNVRVKTVQGKNKIEIEFKDEDDLERIFGLISHGE